MGLPVLCCFSWQRIVAVGCSGSELHLQLTLPSGCALFASPARMLELDLMIDVGDSAGVVIVTAAVVYGLEELASTGKRQCVKQAAV